MTGNWRNEGRSSRTDCTSVQFSSDTQESTEQILQSKLTVMQGMYDAPLMVLRTGDNRVFNEASLQQSGCVLWYGSRIHFAMVAARIDQGVTHCLDRLHQITHSMECLNSKPWPSWLSAPSLYKHVNHNVLKLISKKFLLFSNFCLAISCPRSFASVPPSSSVMMS